MKNLKALIEVARGQRPAELVLRNGHFLDVFNGRFIKGDIAVHNGLIAGIDEEYVGENVIDVQNSWIVPGFVDAHVHIESSMVTPFQYQRAVLPRGTTTIIWDPHEIANVKGIEGIKWALSSSKGLLLDVYLMLSSCVPSLDPKLEFETSAHELTAQDLRMFRNEPRVLGLGEMMNVPGVLSCDEDVLQKIIDFQGGNIDGHCPRLAGKDLNAYAAAGIRSDHEVTSLAEARVKLTRGLHILIREGSAAQNASRLLPLLDRYTSSELSLCADDRNPLELIKEGHIDYIINQALRLGYRPEDIFRIAGFSAARLLGLRDRGAIAPGYMADLCLLQPIKGNWTNGMQISAVYKRGALVNDDILNATKRHDAPNGKNINIKFPSEKLCVADLKVKSVGGDCSVDKRLVIGIKPGEIETAKLELELSVVNGEVLVDSNQDILKIAVFERHNATGNYAVGFVQGFKLKKGAIAMTINHDSHNLIAVGASEQAIVEAVNAIIDIDGGVVVVDGEGQRIDLPLPVAGLMADRAVEETADLLQQQKDLTQKLGCRLEDPFLQLAFLALPVIPSLKITDRGLIDVDNFKKV